MKDNNPTDAAKVSWLKRLKVAIAAVAFIAAGVFGASAVAPAAQPEADETARGFKIEAISVDDDWGKHRFYSARSGSWS